MSELSNWLKKKMEEDGVGLNQVAEYSGVSAPHLSNIIQGKRGYSAKVVMKLAEYFKVDADTLLAIAGLRKPVTPEKEWGLVLNPELRPLLTAENINALPEIVQLSIIALIKLGLEEREKKLSSIEDRAFEKKSEQSLTKKPPSQKRKTIIN